MGEAISRLKKDKEFVRCFCAFVIGMLLLTCLQVFAQDAVVPPTFLDGVLNWIDGLSAGVVAGVIAVVEIILRLVPSHKALSVLVPVKYVLDGVCKVFSWASGLLAVLIASLNRTIPPAS